MRLRGFSNTALNISFCGLRIDSRQPPTRLSCSSCSYIVGKLVYCSCGHVLCSDCYLGPERAEATNLFFSKCKTKSVKTGPVICVVCQSSGTATRIDLDEEFVAGLRCICPNCELSVRLDRLKAHMSQCMIPPSGTVLTQFDDHSKLAEIGSKQQCLQENRTVMDRLGITRENSEKSLSQKRQSALTGNGATVFTHPAAQTEPKSAFLDYSMLSEGSSQRIFGGTYFSAFREASGLKNASLYSHMSQSGVPAGSASTAVQYGNYLKLEETAREKFPQAHGAAPGGKMINKEATEYPFVHAKPTAALSYTMKAVTGMNAATSQPERAPNNCELPNVCYPRQSILNNNKSATSFNVMKAKVALFSKAVARPISCVASKSTLADYSMPSKSTFASQRTLPNFSLSLQASFEDKSNSTLKSGTLASSNILTSSAPLFDTTAAPCHANSIACATTPPVKQADFGKPLRGIPTVSLGQCGLRAGTFRSFHYDALPKVKSHPLPQSVSDVTKRLIPAMGDTSFCSYYLEQTAKSAAEQVLSDKKYEGTVLTSNVSTETSSTIRDAQLVERVKSNSPTIDKAPLYVPAIGVPITSPHPCYADVCSLHFCHRRSSPEAQNLIPRNVFEVPPRPVSAASDNTFCSCDLRRIAKSTAEHVLSNTESGEVISSSDGSSRAVSALSGVELIEQGTTFPSGESSASFDESTETEVSESIATSDESGREQSAQAKLDRSTPGATPSALSMTKIAPVGSYASSAVTSYRANVEPLGKLNSKESNEDYNLTIESPSPSTEFGCVFPVHPFRQSTPSPQDQPIAPGTSSSGHPEASSEDLLRPQIKIHMKSRRKTLESVHEYSAALDTPSPLCHRPISLPFDDVYDARSLREEFSRRTKEALDILGSLDEPHRLSIISALDFFYSNVMPIAAFQIASIWERLTAKQFLQLECVKSTFLKRVLGLHDSAPNRFVYPLGSTRLFIEELKLKYHLLETPAYLELLKKYQNKMAKIESGFFKTLAMTSDLWKAADSPGRYIIVNYAVHGYHHKLCNRPNYHEPGSNCWCSGCGRHCDKYHADHCPTVSSIFILARMKPLNKRSSKTVQFY